MGSLMARALMASIVQHAQSHGSPTSGNARRTSGFPVAGLDALFNPDGGSNRNQDDDSLGTEMANEARRWAGLTYRKGSAVRWRPTLRKPKRGWQGSSKLSVGFVKSRDEKSGAVIVSFPSKSTVTAEPGELVVDEDAEKIRPGILVHVRQQTTQTLGDLKGIWNNRHVIRGRNRIKNSALVLVSVLLGFLECSLAQSDGALSVKVENAATATVTAVRDTDVVVCQLERDLS